MSKSYFCELSGQGRRSSYEWSNELRCGKVLRMKVLHQSPKCRAEAERSQAVRTQLRVGLGTSDLGIG